MYVNVSLRVAGEKWHSVGVKLFEDGSEIWAKKYTDIITKYGQTEDEELWWVVLLGGQINVFNNDGRMVSEKQYLKGHPIDIQFRGKAYKISGEFK